MRVLIGCERSGIVREAFAKRGHDAWSCDLYPSDIPGQHIQGDLLDHLDDGWDMLIAHPPCTHLAVAGAAWFYKKEKEIAESLDFVRMLLDAPVPRVAVENPISLISSRIRKPDQIVHPWMFGDEFSKKTCLWLRGLPPLFCTHWVGRGEMVTYKSGVRMPKWYADAWKLPKAERAKIRSQTFPGLAQAMAAQWG